MTRELDLAIALRAALRWSYRDTAQHVRNGLPGDDGYSREYLSDVEVMRTGVKAANEILPPSRESQLCGNCPYCTRASCPNYKAHAFD